MGKAFSVGVVEVVRFPPVACKVQTPSGPRKSGIPAEVETPAPRKLINVFESSGKLFFQFRKIMQYL